MVATKKEAAIRKRQQIAKASQMMFLWVAGASVIIGASIVLLYVLGQKFIFNEKVLAEKMHTVSTLQDNNKVVSKLEDNLRVLNTNESLIKLQSAADSEPVQVILDALPARANSAALGASLQSNVLLAQPGVTIESLTVTPVGGTSSAGAAADNNAIQFNFTVSTNGKDDKAANRLKDVLERLERSIRAISISSLQVQQQGSRLQMNVAGEAYYQPAMDVELQTKVVKP